MLLNKNIKNNLVRTTLTLLLSFAGFSQLTIFNQKPSDIFILLFFAVLILKSKIKIPLLCMFFIISFIYAWIIGGMENYMLLITNTLLFIIIFSLAAHLRKITLIEYQLYLSYLNHSMFLTNILSLSILFFFPQMVELVADISSGGIRFKGFFTQTNGYAFVALITFPISVYFLNRSRTIFNYINVGIFLVSLLLTQSRGVIYSLIISFGIVYVIYLARSRKIGKFILPTLLVTFLIGATFYFIPEYLENTFGINLSRLNPNTSTSNERNLNEISIESFKDDRLYLVKSALSTIAEHPFGLGYQDHHLIIGELTGIFLVPHNYFLSIILNYGVFLGTIWLIIIAKLLGIGLSRLYNLKTNPENPEFYLTIMLVSLGFFYLTHSSEWSYLYILIAFYLALINRKQKSHQFL